jgi:hypothetical protein
MIMSKGSEKLENEAIFNANANDDNIENINYQIHAFS